MTDTGVICLRCGYQVGNPLAERCPGCRNYNWDQPVDRLPIPPAEVQLRNAQGQFCVARAAGVWPLG